MPASLALTSAERMNSMRSRTDASSAATTASGMALGADPQHASRWPQSGVANQCHATAVYSRDRVALGLYEFGELQSRVSVAIWNDAARGSACGDDLTRSAG